MMSTTKLQLLLSALNLFRDFIPEGLSTTKVFLA